MSDYFRPVIQRGADDEAARRLDLARRRAATMFAALPAEVHELGEMFEAAGHELALVGGPVRDAVLNSPVAQSKPLPPFRLELPPSTLPNPSPTSSSVSSPTTLPT